MPQMILNRPAEAPAPGIAPVVLGPADAAEMCALAELTHPGPFGPEMIRLGRFLGVREQGRLLAMAGQRFRLPGFVEISGVCTHPDAQGRGYARALMNHRPQTPLGPHRPPRGLTIFRRRISSAGSRAKPRRAAAV